MTFCLTPDENLLWADCKAKITKRRRVHLLVNTSAGWPWTVCSFSSITMPASVRISEEQLNHLASLARHDYSISGRVFIKNHENAGKWVQRWCALYQNFLFYFESEDSTKLSGAIYLEHSICERLCLTNLKDNENQVRFCIFYFIFPRRIKKAFVLFYCCLLS